MDKNELLTSIRTLSPAQFKYLLFRLDFPKEYLANNATHIENAISVIEYYNQHGPRNLTMLTEAVNDALKLEASSPVSHSPTTSTGESLAPQAIHEIHKTLIQLGLTNVDVLTVGLPRGYVAGLPLSGPPSSQLLTLLHQANQSSPLKTGDIPLLSILKNALQLSSPFVEQAVFQRYVDALS